MIVAFEQFLNGRALELGLVLEHLLGVSIFPLTVSVLGIEVLLVEGRDEGCWHSLL